MKITQEQSPGITTDATSTATNRPRNARVATTQTSSQTPAATTIGGEKASTSAGAAAAPPTTGRQTAVTFRRDTDGSVYYIVSDARTGDEILQVPPKAVRDAGQGIEEYLKNEESKATATARIAVKA